MKILLVISPSLAAFRKLYKLLSSLKPYQLFGARASICIKQADRMIKYSAKDLNEFLDGLDPNDIEVSYQLYILKLDQPNIQC